MVAVLAEESQDFQLAFSQLMTLLAAALQRLVRKVIQFEVTEMPLRFQNYPLGVDQQHHIAYRIHTGPKSL